MRYEIETCELMEIREIKYFGENITLYTIYLCIHLTPTPSIENIQNHYFDFKVHHLELLTSHAHIVQYQNLPYTNIIT